MNALTTVTKTTSPMVVANVLSEVSNICGRIAEYRVATARINFEREQMHRQANICLQEIANKHNADMEKMKLLGNSHQQIIQQNKKDTEKYYQLINQSYQIAREVRSSLLATNTTAEDKELLRFELIQLTKERQALINEYAQLSHVPMNAFDSLSDSLRTQPREFRNVN